MTKIDKQLDRMLNRDYRRYSRAIRIRKIKDKVKHAALAVGEARLVLRQRKEAGPHSGRTRFPVITPDQIYPVGTILCLNRSPENYVGTWVEFSPETKLYRRIK